MSSPPLSTRARHTTAAALSEILEAETGLFDELAQLAREQRLALARRESDVLEGLADRAETLATRFRLLEGERERLESSIPPPEGEQVDQARARVLTALRTLLREGAVSGTVLTRLADTVAARQAAVASLFGATYLANGRQAGWRVQGSSLSAEG